MYSVQSFRWIRTRSSSLQRGTYPRRARPEPSLGMRPDQDCAAFESTSAHAAARSLSGDVAAGTVAQPAFMTKSRRSYDDVIAPNSANFAVAFGSVFDWL